MPIVPSGLHNDSSASTRTANVRLTRLTYLAIGSARQAIAWGGRGNPICLSTRFSSGSPSISVLPHYLKSIVPIAFLLDFVPIPTNMHLTMVLDGF